MLSRQPPAGWDGAAAWQAEVEQVVARRDPPRRRSFCRLCWRSCSPRSRPPERAGLLARARAAWRRTRAASGSAPRSRSTPRRSTDTGLAALAEIEDAIAELGRDALGARSAAEAMARLRESTQSSSNGADAISPAAAAVSRAEERLTELFHDSDAAAVRGVPHAAAHGRVRAAAVLLAARAGRLAARRVSVQQCAARAGGELGAGGDGLRGGARASRAVLPAAAPA